LKMKLLLFALLLVFVCCDWTKKHDPRFDGWSEERLSKYFGVHINYEVSPVSLIQNYVAPDSFDGRTQWPSCDWAIKDQGNCGSCWAFGLSESLADRWCITYGTNGLILSAQDPVSCDKSDYGCNGGYMDLSNKYADTTGIVTWDCFPYVSGGGSVPACPTTCKNGANWNNDKHKGKSYTHPTNVNDIMAALQQGPCDVAFTVYSDFFDYYSGVYQHKTGGSVGGHAVKMLGWGVDGSTPYWICANSWGTGWAGLGGYFWILKGSNHCGIESNIYCQVV